MPASDEADESASIEFEEFAVPITIGVVADTHLSAKTAERPLPDPLVGGLRRVDLILHAGDVTAIEALARFETFAPVRAVQGNNDGAVLRRELPLRRYFCFGTFTAGLMHGHGIDRLTARRATERIMRGQVDLAIFGHSHRPLCERLDDLILFNPGSATNKRWEPRYSYGIIRVDREIVPELHFY